MNKGEIVHTSYYNILDLKGGLGAEVEVILHYS